MKTVAWIPSSRAAQATAWPWLPALAATTPAARSSGPSSESMLTAPRILNEPVRWRFSAFRTTSRPTSRESEAEPNTGVTCAWPPMRPRAASMSASVGAVRVAKVEHLPKDLMHGGERVEPAFLDRREEEGELGVAAHRLLQVAAGAGGRDREHLRREVPPASLLAAGRRGVGGDRLRELAHPLAGARRGGRARAPGGRRRRWRPRAGGRSC